MDVRISLFLFLFVSAGYGGEILDHYDDEDVLKSCRNDGNCSTGKFCSERGKCVDCYKCSDYKREDVGSEVRRSCAKSASDCGKCLPGYELERCADNKYCDKCIRTRPSTKLPGWNIGKLEDRGAPLISNRNINIGNVENTSNWSVPLAACGSVSVLVIIAFALQFIRKVLKKRAAPILPTHQDGREKVKDPLLPPVAPNDPEVTEPVHYTMNQVPIQSENHQQAQLFSLPREYWPTAPSLIISESTNVGSSGGSTAPSNWEPSVYGIGTVDNHPVQQEEQEAPESTMEEAGDSSRVVRQWLRQNMNGRTVSESSVFSTQDGPVEPPQSFLYESDNELPTTPIHRTSSLTVFNPPVYPSRGTRDPGFHSTQSDFSADDDLAVEVRVQAS